jgi:hypothetical protein
MIAQTYRAVIDGNHVEWIDTPPQPQGPTQVEIALVKSESDSERRARGRRMAQALQRVAEAGGALSTIKDPVAWQREIRKDRLLPGRED